VKTLLHKLCKGSDSSNGYDVGVCGYPMTFSRKSILDKIDTGEPATHRDDRFGDAGSAQPFG